MANQRSPVAVQAAINLNRNILERNSMRIIQIVLITAFMLVSSTDAFSQQSPAGTHANNQNSPVGRWITIDDASGKPASIVVLREENGRITGTIDRAYDPYPKESNSKCTACQGELKDKPLVGMKILWNLSWQGDRWTGGMIFDPDSGKTYNCSLAMENGGSKMKVRGFIGVSLFGRTQYWQREK
jgi:uncharacterized protein (DUF2147 family)